MRPIFIGGCDRSGTTLLGSLLGGTVGAITTPESQFKAKIFRELDWLGDPVGRLIAAALEMITAHDRFCSWTTKLPQLPSPEDNGPTTFRGLLEWVVTHYSQQHEGPAAPQVWIDHDPQNFRSFDDLVHHFRKRASSTSSAMVVPLRLRSFHSTGDQIPCSRQHIFGRPTSNTV